MSKSLPVVIFALVLGLSGCFQYEGKPAFATFAIEHSQSLNRVTPCPDGIQAKLVDKKGLEVTSPVVLPDERSIWGLDTKETDFVLWPEYTVEVWCFAGDKTGYLKAKPRTIAGSVYGGLVSGFGLPGISVGGAILEKREPLPYIRF
jgi:hypothetical protein